MALVRIKWHPEKNELRTFGVLWLVFFGSIGTWWFWHEASAAAYLSIWAIALVGGLLGMTAPMAMRPVYIAWMCLVFPIGWLISHLLLGAIYYGLLLPIGLTLRLFRHDPLQKRLDRNSGSYWLPRKTDTRPERYFRQF